jgi:nitrogen regulatory protein P-II 1
MKLVSAVLPPHHLAAVHDALRRFGLPGLTVSEVFEQDGAQHDESHRGRRSSTDLSPQVRLDVLADDVDAGDLVRIIRRVVLDAAAGARMWVTPVDAAVRVRTGQRGVDAL